MSLRQPRSRNRNHGRVGLRQQTRRREQRLHGFRRLTADETPRRLQTQPRCYDLQVTSGGAQQIARV